MKQIGVIVLACILSFISAKSFSQYETPEKSLETLGKYWNAGNLEGVMQTYWKSDSLRFVLPRRIIQSYDSIYHFYKSNYAFDKGQQGKILFKVHHSYPAGDKYFVIGEFNLEMGGRMMKGLFSVLFRKFGNQWKIIVDHS